MDIPTALPYQMVTERKTVRLTETVIVETEKRMEPQRLLSIKRKTETVPSRCQNGKSIFTVMQQMNCYMKIHRGNIFQVIGRTERASH